MVGMTASPSGMDGFARKLAELQRQIDEIRGSASIKSSILRGDRIEFQDEDGNTFLITGQFAGISSGVEHQNNGIQVIDPDGENVLRAKHDVTASENDVLCGDINRFLEDFTVWANDIQFGTEATPASEFTVDAGLVSLESPAGGSLYLQQDGDVVLHAHSSQTLFLGNGVGEVTINSSTETNVRSAGNVDIDPDGELRFFVGSHAVPANLSHSGNDVRFVSSAAKYKDDIEDIVVDRDVLLSMVGKTYVDKEAKAKRKDLTRYPGFIADEWAEHESTRQFVSFKDGEPEGFHYDRVSVAHHELIKQLFTENADLRKRLDALEQPGKAPEKSPRKP